MRRTVLSAASSRVAGKFHLPDDSNDRKPEGLVEMEGGGHSFRLFLFRTNDQDRWYFQSQGLTLTPLDRDLFESLLTATLQ